MVELKRCSGGSNGSGDGRPFFHDLVRQRNSLPDERRNHERHQPKQDPPDDYGYWDLPRGSNDVEDEQEKTQQTRDEHCEIGRGPHVQIDVVRAVEMLVMSERQCKARVPKSGRTHQEDCREQARQMTSRLNRDDHSVFGRPKCTVEIHRPGGDHEDE